MKIMITGGMGFVGSHLTESLLRKNHDLIILSKSLTKRNNISTIFKKIKFEKVNTTNHSKLKKIIERHRPEIIVHLAGETSHSKSFKYPLRDIESNSKSTLFILETIRKLKLNCKFVLGSTFIVVGKPKKLPVTENTPCNPTTIYGINRLSSEYFTKVYHDVYGLDTNIFRITNSFGPREQIIPQKNAVNYLIYSAFKGNDLTIYNKGKFYRDLVYVSDVVSGIETILKKGKSGELYWISSGKKTWFYELGKILEDLTKTKVQYVDSPTYTKKVDVGNFVVNNSKLRKLGWKPTVSLRKGILNTLDYFSTTKNNF
ncbi:GDP-mannose 4,6-dehydratase [Nitrosopumilus sp.]|uniref:GDP-mannose 4,6-dehydratase n=1 Tax=Nitrosopumilus sp. TaxID=2024843 RepID=UPI003D10516E